MHLGGTGASGLFASRNMRAYHSFFMPTWIRHTYAVLLAILLLFCCVFTARAGDGPALFPLSEIKPGMKGVFMIGPCTHYEQVTGVGEC